MNQVLFRALAATAALVSAVVAAPAFGASPRLEAAAYGVVDFGDGVDFRLSGTPCAGSRTAVHVRVPRGVVTGPTIAGCGGTARVPTFTQVRARGWRQGDPIDIRLVSGGRLVPLRYQRVELDGAKAVAGAPAVVDGTDPDTGAHDKALTMTTGDIVDLGRVNVIGIDSIALRFCSVHTPEIPSPTPTFQFRYDVPAFLTLLQDGPDGPALMHRIDVTHNPFTMSRVQTSGFGPSCWRLGTFPLTGEAVESAPHLFLKADYVVPGTFTINSIDFNGTGARSQAVPQWVTPDPGGMRSVFDGRSFAGWSESGCAIRDGAVTNLRTGDRTDVTGCTVTHSASATNRVIRLDVRRKNYYDNGGIYLVGADASQEIQLRSVGEFLPGGYFGEYAARWQKLSAWPAWSQIEIVQLGARYVVRVNGRTVTDHTVAAAPAPYQLELVTQPEFSYRYGADGGFGNELPPGLVSPDEWGDVWFRNIRIYNCTSVADRTCTSLANVNDGQAPKA